VNLVLRESGNDLVLKDLTKQVLMKGLLRGELQDAQNPCQQVAQKYAPASAGLAVPRDRE
jgi:hypothetical protein